MIISSFPGSLCRLGRPWTLYRYQKRDQSSSTESWIKSEKPVPRGFWKDASNRRKFFDWLSKQLNIRQMEDWYQITKSRIDREGTAQSILRRYYQGNLADALSELYPDHRWESSRFVSLRLREAPKEQLDQRAVFDRVGATLGIQSLDGWYSITRKQLEDDREVNYLLGKYGDSLRNALKAIYPEHSWLDWQFAETARNYWNQQQNQKAFLEWIGKNKLNVERLEDWYKVQLPTEATPPELRSLLVMYHNNSLASALMSVYPTHDWEPWRFSILPKWFWTDSEDAIRHQARYISFLEKELHITSMDAWYRVSREDIRKVGKEIPDRLGLLRVLRRVRPHHNWDPQMFSQKGKKSSQRRLRRALETLFPATIIHEEFRLLSSSSPLAHKPLESIELDYYLPELSLAFEFHGTQHYGDVHTVEQSGKRSQKDLRKAEVCKAAGITFIEIPYWLEWSTKSLAQLVTNLRPDLRPAE